MASLPPLPRILVADNDPELSSVLAMVLEDAGYHVTSASSIEQACTLLAETAFGLVLADSFTLQRDQVLSKTGPIRQVAGATPVVLFTAHPLKPEEARAVGFRDVIAKPFDLDTLLGQMQELLA